MSLLQIIKTISRKGTVDSEIPNGVVWSDIPEEDRHLLNDIMLGTHVGLALHVMEQCGFLTDLVPEIKEVQSLTSSKHYKLIWPHTITVVSQTPVNLAVRWAALFHDLGKAKAFSIRKGKVTFHHHEKISAKIFNTFANKVDIFTPGQRERIHFLVDNLGWIEGYLSTWSDGGIRRFYKNMGVYFDDMISLSAADITTSHPHKKEKILRKIEELKVRIAELKEEDAKIPPLPKGLGTIISTSLQIDLGPRIGEIKSMLEAKIEEGVILANQSPEYYIDFIRGQNGDP